MITVQSKLESLNNFASKLGLEAHHQPSNDGRMKTDKFFLQRGKETISPVLDYDGINHFLLGWSRASKICNEIKHFGEKCFTCKEPMNNMDHNYGTPDMPTCIHCYHEATV